MSTESAPKRQTKRGDITYPIALELLEAYLVSVPEQLLALADPAAPVDDEGWSAKELLGHLIDAAYNGQHRFVRVQSEPLLSFPGYDPQGWVRLQRYAERPWDELVTLWAAANRHLLASVQGLGPDQLGKPCLIGREKPCTLEWLIIDYAGHVRHHLRRMGVVALTELQLGE